MVHNFVVVFDGVEQKTKRKNPPNKDPPLTQSCRQQTLSSTTSKAQAPNLNDAREAFPTSITAVFDACSIAMSVGNKGKLANTTRHDEHDAMSTTR